MSITLRNVCKALIVLAVFIHPMGAYAKPQPSRDWTNTVWPCSYPYPMGLCQMKKRKDKDV